MYSHTPPKYQYVERTYRVVIVRHGGERSTLSEHDSFLAAERARRMLCSQEDMEIRIETAVEVEAVSKAG